AAAVGVEAGLGLEGKELVPAYGLFLAILILGIIDAGWGAAAIGSFLIVSIFGGALRGWNEALLLLTLSSFFVGLPIIVGKVRPFRRAEWEGAHGRWKRLGDFVIAPLMAFWLASVLLHLIPALSKIDPPMLKQHAEAIAIVAAGAMLARVSLEHIAAVWFPNRYRQSVPPPLPDQRTALKWASAGMRVAFFLLLAWGVIGSCWQLWAAGAVYGLGELLPLIKHRLPTTDSLYRFVPRDLVKIVAIVAAAKLIALMLPGLFEDPLELMRWGLVLAVVPGTLFRLLEGFTGRGAPLESSFSRVAGVVFVGLFVFLAFLA
ncbi:MAG: hypothetical protein WCO96_01990, partial [Actinomycetes bacterium]